MVFDWKTAMRRMDDYDARRADQLSGQAAATCHEDGRWTITVMTDAGCFASSVTISADDALALAHMITERNRR